MAGRAANNLIGACFRRGELVRFRRAWGDIVDLPVDVALIIVVKGWSDLGACTLAPLLVTFTVISLPAGKVTVSGLNAKSVKSTFKVVGGPLLPHAVKTKVKTTKTMMLMAVILDFIMHISKRN
jgi:hypothetical protein